VQNRNFALKRYALIKIRILYSQHSSLDITQTKDIINIVSSYVIATFNRLQTIIFNTLPFIEAHRRNMRYFQKFQTKLNKMCIL